MASTKASRAQPSRRFEDYILLKTNAPEINLTSISNSRFLPCGIAGVGFADDATSSPIDIGFSFNIDQINYKKVVVNTNGWMVLLDPTNSSFTSTNVLASGSLYKNSFILSTFLSDDVLLAPWFDDLRNVASSLGQFTDLISAAKKDRLEKGFDSYIPQVNESKNSVKYFFDEKSDQGRRFIVRWNSFSSFASIEASSQLQFEAVLYENGKIEYRYAPRNNMSVSGYSAYEGATIGIFMPNGTNRFRDFSIGLGYQDQHRQRYKYGGAIYDAAYTDFDTSTNGGNCSTAYNCMLRASLHWPSLSDVGSMYTFMPPVNRRCVLPRLEQRKIDSRLTLPIVPRTGDSSRLGNDKSIFDDRVVTTSGVTLQANTQETTLMPGTPLDGMTVTLPYGAHVGVGYSYVASPSTDEEIRTIDGDPLKFYLITLKVQGLCDLGTFNSSVPRFSGSLGTANPIWGGGLLDTSMRSTNVWGSDGRLAIGNFNYPFCVAVVNSHDATHNNNWFSITTTDPPQTYGLNAYAVADGTDLYELDYTCNIIARGGSTIKLKADSADGYQWGLVLNGQYTYTLESLRTFDGFTNPTGCQWIRTTFLSSSIAPFVEPIYVLSPAIASSSAYKHSTNSETVESFIFSGQPTITYNASFKVEGLIECCSTTGSIGVAHPINASDPYVPNTGLNLLCFDKNGNSSLIYDAKPFVVNGEVNQSDANNPFSLEISDPPATYYLNNYYSISSIIKLNYTAKVPIKGGATVTVRYKSMTGEQYTVNTGSNVVTVPVGIPLPSSDGQWAQVTLISSSIISSDVSLSGLTAAENRQIVNYPTTLNRFFSDTDLGALQRQDLFSGDFETTGTLNQQVVEQFIVIEDTKKIAPFSEHNLYENDSTSDSFFTTGSNIENFGDGFKQSLKAKTKVKLTFPVENSIRLLESASAIYYYNKRTNSWNIPQNSTYHLIDLLDTTNPNDSKNDIVFDRSNDSVNHRVIEDHKGFGPIGNFIVSGSVERGSTDFLQTDTSINATYDSIAHAEAMGKFYAKTVTNNEDYRATLDETFSIPTMQPFLIERAVVEIPVAAGDLWFKDMTACMSTLENSGSGFDFGGPAITFALFNQTIHGNETRRDLILSGVFTHFFDNTSSIKFENYQPITSTYQIRNSGFLGYSSSPSAVITPNSSSIKGYTYTGSVLLRCEPQVTNGLLLHTEFVMENADAAVNRANVDRIFKANQVGLDSFELDYAQKTKIAYINNFGRCASGFEPSGRSILGKEFISSKLSKGKVNNPLYYPNYENNTQIATALAAGSNFKFESIIPLESSVHSPYLALPGDTLVLAIAKSRPVYMGSQFDTATKTSGSVTHDLQLITGTISLTLYGSLIREGKEFHDTLNQPLASEAIHEIVVGNDPILDQFEVAYQGMYASGTYDDYVVGNLITEYTLPHGRTGLRVGTRGRAFSKTNTNLANSPGTGEFDSITSLSYRLQPWSEKAGSVRLLQISDMSERFYDSLLPAIDKCIEANGAQLVFLKAASGDVVTVDHIILNLDCRVPGELQVSPDQALYNDWKWSRSFPYEPRYSKAARQLDVSKSFVSSLSIQVIDSVTTVINISPTIQSVMICRSIGTKYPCVPMGLSSFYNKWEYIVTDRSYDQTTPYLTDGANNTDLTKFLYGFGDINNMFPLATTSGDGTGGIIGSNHHVDFRKVFYDLEDAYLGVSPIIRGWKYGLYSGLPAYSKAYFRQGRYGQLRDMLEQRPYTKFFITNENDQSIATTTTLAVVEVQFIDAKGNTTDPLNTWSQNLSFEATSSMPYFDGETKNRTDINSNTVNANVISFRM